MGACCCAGLDQNTRYINDRLASEDKAQSRTNKLLFLGPGGSGKSTIFKQLQWLYHPGGFSNEDCLMLREHIYCQITQQMKAAIKHYIYKEALTVRDHKNGTTTTISMKSQIHQSPSQESQVVSNDGDGDGDNNSQSTPHSKDNEIQKEDMLNINSNEMQKEDNHVTYSGDEDTTIDEDAKMNGYDEISMQDAINIVQNHGDVTMFDEKLADAITYIWKNKKEIRNAFKNTAKVKNKILDETTAYFWDEIDRIKDKDYVPNETDIIKVRYRTTGVIEKKFEINNAKFHIFDVGGQKSERKKWINCFNEVKAVIFVISLSCYNELMYEDLETNCMVDSLNLFNETINNKLFLDTHIILFLNKKDLFRKKIITVPITACPAFNDFDQFKHETTFERNEHNYDQTTCYIKFKFESLNKNSKRKQIYTHLTCAMDKSNIENVFNDVKHIVITTNLFNEGLS